MVRKKEKRHRRIKRLDAQITDKLMIRVEQDSLHAIILFLFERGKRHRLLIRYRLMIFLFLFFSLKMFIYFSIEIDLRQCEESFVQLLHPFNMFDIL